MFDDNVVDTIIAGATSDWLFLELNGVGDESLTSSTGPDAVTDLA